MNNQFMMFQCMKSCTHTECKCGDVLYFDKNRLCSRCILRSHTVEYKRKSWNLFTVRFGPDEQMETVSLRNPQGRPDSILLFPLPVLMTVPALCHRGLRRWQSQPGFPVTPGQGERNGHLWFIQTLTIVCQGQMEGQETLNVPKTIHAPLCAPTPFNIAVHLPLCHSSIKYCKTIKLL